MIDLRTLLPSILISATLGVADAAPQPRIVPCDEPVKSAKRGLCINEASAADFLALSPTVSWYYSWHYADTNHAPPEADIDFIPMAWGDREEDIRGLDTYLASHKPRFALGINEPNLKDQAFIDPKTTAELYEKIKAVTDRHGIPLIAPNMALGSGEDASIRAYDPIEKKDVTYTFMTPFLKAVFDHLGDVKVEATSSHTYGNFAELKWMVGMMHDEFGLPVYVTEFADWHAADDAAEREYLIQSVDFMERTPTVAGYAWFKERVDGNQKLSLLANESGKLTPLGELYVAMPVHEPDLFYKLPGRLESERYVAIQNAEIAETTDDAGLLEMQVLGGDHWIDYNVAVADDTPLNLRVRISTKPGAKLTFRSGDKVLASITIDEKGWNTAESRIELLAGTQTIRVQSDQPARLNWMEFARN